MSAVDLLDATLRASGRGTWAEAAAARLDRLRSKASRRRISLGLPVERRPLPLQARLGGGRALPCRPARPARPPRELRAGERGVALPPGRAAGARLPQHHLQRDAGLEEARRRAARPDPRERRRAARHRRGHRWCVSAMRAAMSACARGRR